MCGPGRDCLPQRARRPRSWSGSKNTDGSLADPEIKSALETATGGDVRASTPDEMRALIISETDKWSKVINDAGIPRI